MTHSDTNPNHGGLLGIDPGTNTGWFYIDHRTGSYIQSGSYSLKCKHNSKLVVAERCLNALLHLCRPSIVIFEAALTVGGRSNGRMLLELQGLTKLILDKGQFQYHAVYPSSVKKCVAGNGRATKEKVAEIVSGKWKGAHFKNDHETDAAAIALWGLKRFEEGEI